MIFVVRNLGKFPMDSAAHPNSGLPIASKEKR
jgi:hypothetical protein